MSGVGSIFMPLAAGIRNFFNNGNGGQPRGKGCCVKLLDYLIGELNDGERDYRAVAEVSGISRGVLALFLYHQICDGCLEEMRIGLFHELREQNPHWAWPPQPLNTVAIEIIISRLIGYDFKKAGKSGVRSEEERVLDSFLPVSEVILEAEIEAAKMREEEEKLVLVQRGTREHRKGVMAVCRPPKKKCAVHRSKSAVLSSIYDINFSICKKCSIRIMWALKNNKVAPNENSIFLYLRERALEKKEIKFTKNN